MTTSSEEWRDIPGYEGRYQVSDQGRVRSVDRYVKCGQGGRGTRLVKGRVLRPAGQKADPHLRVVLGHKANGSCVHSLVALTFLGPRPDGYDVRHLDGDPLNNRADNLAYGTRSENNIDVFRIGKSWRGSITAPQAQEIRARLAEGETAVAIAKDMRISLASVYGIKQRRTFQWLK